MGVLEIAAYLRRLLEGLHESHRCDVDDEAVYPLQSIWWMDDKVKNSLLHVVRALEFNGITPIVAKEAKKHYKDLRGLLEETLQMIDHGDPTLQEEEKEMKKDVQETLCPKAEQSDGGQSMLDYLRATEESEKKLQQVKSLPPKRKPQKAVSTRETPIPKKKKKNRPDLPPLILPRYRYGGEIKDEEESLVRMLTPDENTQHQDTFDAWKKGQIAYYTPDEQQEDDKAEEKEEWEWNKASHGGQDMQSGDNQFDNVLF